MSRALLRIHEAIDACRACPAMVGPPVHGPALESKVLLLGQAPGPHEARLGRPFAYTAGTTLFRWFREGAGVDEERLRARVYFAAVARCFPGKASGGGDRVPDAREIHTCGSLHVAREVAALEPRLLLAVGRLAIAQSLGSARFGLGAKLTEVVGRTFASTYWGHELEVLCLPHPSGASSWHRVEPGRTLLAQALALLRAHPVWRATFDDVRGP